jgi:uncharacterized protein (TIGR02147 family)
MQIFQFEDYKEYLKAYIQSQPKRGWGLLSKWSDLLSVKSSFLGQVLNGEKQLSPEHAHKLGCNLNLDRLSMEYFINMVSRERAGDFELKNYYSEIMAATKEKAAKLKSHISATKSLSDEEQGTYFSRWLFSAIRIYVSIGKGKTLSDITERFQISRNMAKNILDFLCETGLCLKKRRPLYFRASTPDGKQRRI